MIDQAWLGCLLLFLLMTQGRLYCTFDSAFCPLLRSAMTSIIHLMFFLYFLSLKLVEDGRNPIGIYTLRVPVCTAIVAPVSKVNPAPESRPSFCTR